MTKRRRYSTAAVAALAAMSATAALADDKSNGNGDGHDNTFATKLIGYNETPLTLNSTAGGTFVATVNDTGTAINYTLSYHDVVSGVTQAHIHFGRPAITGQIVLFLCTNLAPPAGVPVPQMCPTPSGTISGTLTAADVIARPTQGIDAGAAGLAEMIQAMRASAAYANVHSTTCPGGEIRGAVGPADEDDHD